MKKPDQSQRKAIIKIFLFVLVMLILTLAFGKPIIRAVQDPDAFRQWVEGYGLWGKILFLGMMYVQTVIAFIPGEPLEIAAGYAFGAVPGLIITMIGQMLGSVTVFLFVRRYGIKLVEVFVSREQIASVRFLRDERKLEAIVFFVFLTPGTPKDALCYFVGLTPMRLSVWMLISSFARLPSIVTSTIGGDALGIGNTALAVIVFALTFAVSLAGYLGFIRLSRIREKMKQEKKLRRKLLKEKRREKKQKLLLKAGHISFKRKNRNLRKTGV